MKALHFTPAVAALAIYAGATALSFTVATPAMAASQHECEIWLCLPQGFGPSACHAAHSAMLDRISPPHPKPPLPPFSQCSAHGSSEGLSYTQGMETHIPQQTVCMDRPRNGIYESAADRRRNSGYCRNPKTIPEHWAKNQYCVNGYLADHRFYGGDGGYQRTSNIRCDQTKRSLTIFQRGQQLGNTYRW